MKKTAIFRFLLVVMVCSLLLLTACVKNSETDKSETKQTNTVESTEINNDSSEIGEIESVDGAEITTEEIDATTQATTEEPETYEKLTDGPGASMPEVEV